MATTNNEDENSAGVWSSNSKKSHSVNYVRILQHNLTPHTLGPTITLPDIF